MPIAKREMMLEGDKKLSGLFYELFLYISKTEFDYVVISVHGAMK